jgi:hypothetical protein
MPLCCYGGYCTRVRDHQGAHTAFPFPSTKRFDRRVEDAVILLMLDFPTPPWADLLDDHG